MFQAYLTTVGRGLGALLASGVFAGAALAAGAPLWQLQQAAGDAKQQLAPADLPAGSQPITFNAAALRQFRPGMQTAFPTADGRSLTIVWDRQIEHASGNTSWVGRMAGESDGLRTIVTMAPDGTVYGRIASSDNEWMIESRHGQAWLLDRTLASLRAVTGHDHDDDDALLPPAADFARSQALVPKAARTAVTPKAGAKTQVDVAILYDPNFQTRHGSGVNARIDQLVTTANQAYTDSQVDIELRVVHRGLLNYSARTDNGATLNAITPPHSGYSEKTVGPLRNQYGADFVVFLRPYDKSFMNSCGVAWIGGGGLGDIANSSEWAYGVVADGSDVGGSSYFCSVYTFAHELGHNMGSMHDRRTVTNNGARPVSYGVFKYSFGHGVNSSFATIMAYGSSFGASTVGYFSNPLLNSCKGQPCGVSETDPDNAANNALSLNNVRAKIAAYRSPPNGQATLTLQVTGNGQVSVSPGGGVCRSSGGAGCTATVAGGTEVTLQATPDANHALESWGGACSGVASTCKLTLTGDTSVSARFATTGTPKPDLRVSLISAGGSGTPGGKLTVDATVVNDGNAVAAQSRVAFMLSTDRTINASDRDLNFGCAVPSLNAGSTSRCSGELTIPADVAPGTYYIGAIADSSNAVAEGDETNNSAAASSTNITTTVQAKPDLSITLATASASALAGGKVTVDFIVANGGTQVAPASRASVVLSTDADITVSDRALNWNCDVPSLAASATYRCSGELTVPADVVAGTYYVGFIADARNEVAEGNETNNTRAAASPTVISAANSSLPDLRVQQITAGSSVRVGAKVQVDVTVVNGGSAEAAGSRVQMLLSSDSAITRSDRDLGFGCDVPALAVGATYRCAGDVVIPSGVTAGSYYVGAYVDFNNAAAESNEDNNAQAAANATSVTGGTTVKVQNGWYWNRNESGRGFFFELLGDKAFVAAYLYDANGKPMWFVVNDVFNGDTLTGAMQTFFQGQTLTGSYRSPAQGTSLGTFTMKFHSPTQATITWPGGTLEVERFGFAGNGEVRDPEGAAPESGWWWNAGESGRGYSLEVQGNKIFLAGFMYDDSGSPVWYVTTGTLSSSPVPGVLPTYSGAWQQFGQGQTLTGPYRPANLVNGNVGGVTLQFNSSGDGILVLPTGRHLKLSRFKF